jgi:hypothetical protein
MAKSKLRQEQDGPMDVFSVRMTAAHARRARKLGNGNISEGVRMRLEDEQEFKNRRVGAADRRKKRR